MDEGLFTKKGHVRILFCFLLALMVGLLTANAVSIRAQPALGARILDVAYVSKIYDRDSENLNFTVINLGRIDLSGASLFFFKVYADSSLMADESSSPWECRPGIRVSHNIVVSDLRGPDRYLMRAELYWKNQTTAVLEDIREFEVLVVKLYVTGWSQSISTVQLGARTPSRLTVSFQNGGNDKMFSAQVSVTDLGGLQVDPQTRSIGDISAGDTIRANFSVSAPSTTSMGSHVLTFEVLYLDFRGTAQEETVSVTLTVVKLGTILELNVPDKVKYSYPIEIGARLLDANGDPISDQTIKFYVLSQSRQEEIGTNVTDSSGYVRLRYHGILDAGDYRIKAVYEGSASQDATLMTIGIRILAISTKIIPNIPGSITVGQSVNVTIQLTDEVNKPISSQTLEFYADNVKFGTAVTNDKGLASILYAPGKRGSMELRIKYEGGGNYAGAEWSGTIPIEAIRTTLTLFVNGFAIQGNNLVFKATLKDSFGNPIQSATLGFTVVAGHTIVNQTLMTDSEGSASLSFRAITTDTIRIDVAYSGDLRYDESRANATVTVLSPILLGGIVVAIIGAALVGVLGFMTFKLKLDPLAWIRRRTAPLAVRAPQTKPVATATVAGAPSPSVLSDLDEKIYSYIVEHSGVISVKQAASDLGITPDQLKESTERLKRTGRLG